MKFISTKTLLNVLFCVLLLGTVFVHFTEDYYSLKQLSLDIQTIIVLIASLFYKEETK